jgi:hypothetical protein
VLTTPFSSTDFILSTISKNSYRWIYSQAIKKKCFKKS